MKHYKKHPIEYAVYDYEDNLLMVGSIREVAEFTGMTPGSIRCTRSRRGEERGKSKAQTRKLYTFVKLEKESEESESEGMK